MTINIIDEINNDFLVYASEVNNNRAFPDSRDGLKPGQRAALYSMYSHKYFSNKPHVKCATVTGGTIADYWPHGDAGVYDTIVRMAQPWVNNIPEIDFHGGYGSQLGGSQAAAPRYTECRLSEAVELGMFAGIDCDAVDMIDNFSETLKLPSVLPSIMPRLFVNGSQGIGYTITQEWEPSNLIEFESKVKEYIKTGDVTVDNIYPDYPTGGVIVNKKDIANIYRTGKGNVILRAKLTVEPGVIKITELPYQVFAEPLIQKIKDLVNADVITSVEDIYNKSDDNGLLIEIEYTGDSDKLLNILYKNTDLQKTFSVNQMALVDNGCPVLMTLKDYISTYVKHNAECISRINTFKLNKAMLVKEEFEGFVKASSMLDDIIKIIRNSDNESEACNELVKIGFTDLQAKSIVGMRLGKLTKLDIKSNNDKLAQVDKEISGYKSVLNDINKELLKQLHSFVVKFGWLRRTEVIDIDLSLEKEVVKQRTKEDKYFILALTSNNTIKKVEVSKYKASKCNDIISTVKLSSKSKLTLISDDGMMYKLPVSKIHTCSMASTGDDLSEYGKVLGVFGESSDMPYIVFMTEDGKIKKMNSEDVLGIHKNVGTSVVKTDTKLMHVILTDDCKLKVNTSIGEIEVDTEKYKCKGRSAGCVKIQNKTIKLI